ncbi:MAG: MaoC family dehydratase N-terminal domain-containing protein [Rhizobiaceae bacterium]|nr:MaoC family dehydratase N-terminal domain-containing protein [Rhizobiaceae bacterium]
MSGDTLEEWDFLVEEGKVREFARAVRDPSWQDSVPVPPPTFPVVASAAFVERLVTQYLDLDRSRTVHGEERFEYFGPIRIGQVLRCRARKVSDEVKTGKRGGRMRIVTTEVEFAERDTGELLCRETMVSIEKEAAS